MYVHRVLAYQAIHPCCDVGKLVPVISRIYDDFEFKSSILPTSVTFLCLLDLRQMISSFLC